MKEYMVFMGLLAVIYIGYLQVQAKEKKMMKRYYGYRSRTRKSTGSKQLKRAA